MPELDSNMKRQVQDLSDYANGLLDAGQSQSQVVGFLMVKGLDYQAASNLVNALLKTRGQGDAAKDELEPAWSPELIQPIPGINAKPVQHDKDAQQCVPELLGKAENHFAKQRYEECIADSTHAIHLQSESWAAYRIRGQAYWRLGRCNEAASDLEKAVRLKPNDDVARNLLQLALGRTVGKVEKAPVAVEDGNTRTVGMDFGGKEFWRAVLWSVLGSLNMAAAAFFTAYVRPDWYWAIFLGATCGGAGPLKVSNLTMLRAFGGAVSGLLGWLCGPIIGAILAALLGAIGGAIAGYAGVSNKVEPDK